VHTLAIRMVGNWYHRQVNNWLNPCLRTVLFISYTVTHGWLVMDISWATMLGMVVDRKIHMALLQQRSH